MTDFEEITRNDFEYLLKSIKDHIDDLLSAGEDPIRYTNLLVNFLTKVNKITIDFNTQFKQLKEREDE